MSVDDIRSKRTPLEAVMGRLDDADEWCHFVSGCPGGADGWLPFEQIVTADAIAAAGAALLAGEAAEMRDVAGATLASQLVGSVISGGVDAFVTERRTYSMSAPSLLVHREPGGRVDGVAVQRPDVWMLATDCLAEHADAVVVETVEELRAHLALQIAELCQLVFPAVGGQFRYGAAGMWGSVADDIAAGAVWTAQMRDTDPGVAWHEASLLIDAISVAAPRLRVRPRVQIVDVTGGTWHQAVRGTCCLAYKTEPDADPEGAGYCTSCPLRSDEVRAERIVAWREAVRRQQDSKGNN